MWTLKDKSDLPYFHDPTIDWSNRDEVISVFLEVFDHRIILTPKGLALRVVTQSQKELIAVYMSHNLVYPWDHVDYLYGLGDELNALVDFERNL